MEYPPMTFSPSQGHTNVLLQSDGSLARLGYRGFLGLVWALFKANRTHRQAGFKSTISFTLPMGWL